MSVDINSIKLDEISAVVRYSDPLSDYPMRNPGRKHCGLIYTLSGRETYHFKKGDIKTQEDTVLIIPKNEVYTIDSLSPQVRVICIDFETVGTPSFEPCVFSFKEKIFPIELFVRAERIWKSKRTAYKAETIAVFYQILTILIKNQESFIHPANYMKIAPAVEYLQGHYTDRNLKVEALCEMVNINPKYFYQIFVSKFGISPKEYILKLRLSRAQELLAYNNISIREVAESTGFCDVYHFSRTFKAKIGQTPLEYRKLT